MHILISGTSGFVGRRVVDSLTATGYRITRLIRGPVSEGNGPECVVWDPASRVDLSSVKPDAVIHLAGESIMGRWTADKKQRIYNSRVIGTRLLAESVASLARKPKVFIGASAIGLYGEGGNSEFDEFSPRGIGFLADLTSDWEVATQPAMHAGIRVAIARFGIILDPGGAALGGLLPMFRWGLGGRLGNGRQWMSWVAMRDVLGALDHLLMRDDLSGPFNFTAPNPVTNGEFTRTLGRILKRPTICAVPRFALKMLLGEMGDAAFVSQRVLPRRLLDCGFEFKFPLLDPALRDML